MARLDIHPQESDKLVDHDLYYDKGRQVVEVTLSERNLLALLAKLYIDGSRRTLINTDTPEGYVLKLVAEDDKTHYSSVTRGGAPAGAMASPTEEFVQLLKTTLDNYKTRYKLATLFHKSVEDSQGEAS